AGIGRDLPNLGFVEGLDRSRLPDSPVAVDHGADPHVDSPAHRSAVLDRSKSANGQMFVVPTRAPPPAVVGNVDEEIRFGSRITYILSGQHRIGVFKTDQDAKLIGT